MKLATLCYVRRGGSTLMLHRVKKANDMHAGKWNGLGGKMEPGETPEECAVREIYEESGLRVVEPQLRGLITFPQFYQGEDWYTFLFVAESFTGRLIDSPEGELQWIVNAQLLDLNLWPGDRIFIPWLDDGRFFSAKFVYEAGELTKYSVVFYTPFGVEQREASPASYGEHNGTLPSVSGGVAGSDPADRTGYHPEDDAVCWLCEGPVIKRHCKIICQRCGFTRDCSDP